MVICPQCSRHHQGSGEECPFCSNPGVVPVRRAFVAAMAALTPVLLAACYGMAPKDCDTGSDTACSTTDADDDGYTSYVDCDETNPDVNPAAVEVCDDGIDNDCDEITDSADSDCA